MPRRPVPTIDRLKEEIVNLPDEHAEALLFFVQTLVEVREADKKKRERQSALAVGQVVE